MSAAVAEAVAEDVNSWARASPFDVIWHGGEPLAAGREYLAALMAPFRGVRHHIQTNATLIDDEWCRFFADRDIRVGLSIDGPADRNAARATWSGQPAFGRIMRGADHLRRHGIEFSAIAVVSDPTPDVASQLYEFFADLGCVVLGINIEEKEGVNTRSNDLDAEKVGGFWAALTEAWRRNPVIRIRELERVLGYVAAEFDGRADDFLPATMDPFPTVAHNGDVVLFSPELAGFADAAGALTGDSAGERSAAAPHPGFAVGNVLQRSLAALVAGGAGQAWVAEFREGVELCRTTCPYFGFCGGGQPANRYFEHGRFDTARTCHCQNSRISLIEGVVAHARAH
jgi:uncharacterized protein